jgi:hypothetical protein
LVESEVAQRRGTKRGTTLVRALVEVARVLLDLRDLIAGPVTGLVVGFTSEGGAKRITKRIVHRLGLMLTRRVALVRTLR